MFKYISLFVCLLGVSLASTRSSDSESLLEAVKKHQKYLAVCEDELGEAFKSCDTVLDDLVQLESDVESAVTEAADDYAKGLELFEKFSTCGTKSIFKQVACYEEVVSSAKTLVSTVEEEAEEIQESLTSDVAQIESDLENCVTSGYTSQLLNKKIAMCKLRLMLKN